MNKYEIEIIETLSRVVEEEAQSYEEARNQVIDKYYNAEIVLDYNDLDEVIYQHYPSQKMKSNFNISIDYDREKESLKIFRENKLIKEYDNCETYEDCLMNLKSFMNNYIKIKEETKEKDVITNEIN